MSNLSIIERLEQQLSAYSAGEIARAAFVDFLSNGILALENVPIDIRYELRTHEKAIEIEGYSDDEGFESDTTSACDNLYAWL